MNKEKTKPNFVTADIQRELYEKIRIRANKENYSIRKYVNLLLNSIIQNEMFAHQLFLKLKKIKITNNECFIRNSLGNFFVVEMKDNKVWCNTCSSHTCEHVLFSLLCYDISNIFKREVK